MKKFMYEAPSVEVVEMELGCPILDGSPNDSSTSQTGGGLD